MIPALVLTLAACSAAGVDEGFRRARIVVGAEQWEVAVADTAGLRSRGLHAVEDLGDLDGMLFVFPGDTEASFTMRGTRMAIDVAFFTEDGTALGIVEMVPCRSEPCPSYRPPGPYRFALEVAAGGFEGVAPLVLDAASLPGWGG